MNEYGCWGWRAFVILTTSRTELRNALSEGWNAFLPA